MWPVYLIAGGGLAVVVAITVFITARVMAELLQRAFDDAIALYDEQAHDYRVRIDQLNDELIQSEARAQNLRIENSGLWRWKAAMDDLEEQDSAEITAVIATAHEGWEGDEP